jgi:deoxyribose-phosphate aldolase
MLKIQPVPPDDPKVPDSPEGARNPIAAFDPDLIASIRIDGRADTPPVRRTEKKPEQAARLLQAVQCIDLTSLSSNDTPERVKQLCAKARQPLRPQLQAALGVSGITTAAVCVYHAFIGAALEALSGTSIPVAAVSAGFPHGLSPLKARLLEVEESVAAGAQEIDIVIDRSKALAGNWQGVYDEVRAFREACEAHGKAHLKTIIGAGDLGTLTNVAKASVVCMMAGADFIKTSTGKEAVNATPEFAEVMARMIGFWRQTTGYKVGFKAAGGISKAEEAVVYQAVMQEELGADWLAPRLFRIGATRLLGDIEQQLEVLAGK